MPGLSLVAVSGGSSGGGAQASHWSSLLLQGTGSRVQTQELQQMDLVAPKHVGSS